MSVNYEPLDHSERQIRVLTIQPAVSPSTAPAGRTRNPWKSRYHNLDSEHEPRMKNGSAVRLDPVDEMIRCTIDTVSLGDVTDEYRAYKRTSSGETAWPEYIKSQPLSTTHYAPVKKTSWRTEWKRRLARSKDTRQHAGNASRKTTFDLPSWRTASWKSENSLDERVVTLAQPQAFAPRYKWGDFSALSYTWGDEKARAQILVNGQTISIGKNAEAALRCLRALPETAFGMRYWIDALCINQDDKDECSREVKRMGNLYKAAWSVVVWLGEAADQSDEACDLICGMCYTVEPIILRAKPQVFQEDVTTRAVMQLLSRPYWYRAWIIQELAMNHENTTFLCGDRAFFRQELCVLLDFIAVYTNSWNGVAQQEDPDSTPLSPSLWALADHISALLELDATATNPPPLERVLALSQRAQCKDTRDKVYSIFNLLPEALASLIQPNYNLPVTAVREDFSRKVAAVKSLDFLLSWAGQPKSDATASWCIELTNPFPRNHIQWLRKRAANGGKEFAHHFSQDGALVCEGVQVDVIESLAPGTLTPSDLDLRPAEQVSTESFASGTPVFDDPILTQTLVDTLLLQHPMKSSVPRSFLNIPWASWPQVLQTQHSSSETQYSKDVLANADRFWEHIAHSGFLAPFNKFRRENGDFRIGRYALRDLFPTHLPSIQISRPPSPVMLDVEFGGVPQQVAFTGFLQNPATTTSGMIARDMKLAAISLVGRRLAITKNGWLALVPEDARLGDVVAILGCPFPVLLRPVGGGYRFVGEGFVHGIMDGEAVREESTGREEFVLL